MLEALYLSLPAPLQSLAISALGKRNRVARSGPAFTAHQAFLRTSEKWSTQQMLEWQEGELFGLLTHAFSTVPHFRDLRPDRSIPRSDAWTALDDLPYLEKADLRRDPPSFTSEVFRTRELLSVITSGTTGSPTRFLVDQSSRQTHFAYFDRLLRWANLDPAAWHAVFMGRILGREDQLNARPWRTDYANRRVYFSSYHITRENLPRYLGRLQEQTFEWIEGYPSAIGNLARLSLEEGLEVPKPKAVIPSSEILDGPTRQAIQSLFGDVIWEFYAAAEQAAFISQCESGSLHVNPEYGVVEFDPRGSDEDGHPLYELVATSFRNRAMPLIRYRTDDLLTRNDTPCACGRAFPRVGRIVGRDSGTILLPDGRRITGISNVPKGLPIEKSQLVQTGAAELEFRVVPSPGAWSSATEDQLRRRLRERVGPSAGLRIRVVSSIPPGPNGKSALVKRLVSLDDEPSVPQRE